MIEENIQAAAGNATINKANRIPEFRAWLPKYPIGDFHLICKLAASIWQNM